MTVEPSFSEYKTPRLLLRLTKRKPLEETSALCAATTNSPEGPRKIPRRTRRLSPLVFSITPTRRICSRASSANTRRDSVDARVWGVAATQVWLVDENRSLKDGSSTRLSFHCSNRKAGKCSATKDWSSSKTQILCRNVSTACTKTPCVAVVLNSALTSVLFLGSDLVPVLGEFKRI